MAEAYVKLHNSEGIVAQMAAQIFAGYVAAGKVSDMNEDVMIKRAIDIAIKMALQTDKRVDSDNERNGS